MHAYAWTGRMGGACVGEGHHSYHHCFPTDFRHGHRWADWDPTKWCILLWYYMGLAYDLKTTSDNQIRQQQMIVLKEEQREKEKGVLWGPQDNGAPYTYACTCV